MMCMSFRSLHVILNIPYCACAPFSLYAHAWNACKKMSFIVLLQLFFAWTCLGNLTGSSPSQKITHKDDYEIVTPIILSPNKVGPHC